MTDRHPLFHAYPADDLLRTPFLANQRLDLLSYRVADTGLSLVDTPPQCQVVGLLGAVALQTPITQQLPADSRFIASQQLSRDGMLHMMFKLGLCAEEKWRRLRGFDYLAKVVIGIKFKDGVEVTEVDQAAA